MQEKCCCVKEPTGTVPIGRIIAKVDALAAVDDSAGIERVLTYWEKEARTLNDRRGLLEILSEEIGFYRRSDKQAQGMAAINDALAILGCENTDSVSYATIYLNIATTLKAFDKLEESLPYYLKAKELYEKFLEAGDARFAGLYNNYGTALMDMGNFDEAKKYYLLAIDILKKLGEENYGEVAITYINLAQLAYTETQTDNIDRDDIIDDNLMKAYDALNASGLPRDGRYASVCRKCALAFGFYGYFLQKAELEERVKSIFGHC